MFFITRVCCHCDKEMGTIPTEVKPKPGLDKSHGICDDCMQTYYPNVNRQSDDTPKIIKEGGVCNE